MKRSVKYILRGLGVLFLLLVLLFIGLSMYVSANKKELLQKASTEISNKIGGQVSIADMSVSLFKNFPYLSIQLKKVDIRDSLFARHGHHFFYAEKLFVCLNPVKLALTKISINKLEIDSGSLYLFTDSSGYSNGYLLKGKKKPATEETSTTTKNVLDKIELSRFAITIQDVSKSKLFDFYVNKLSVQTNTSGSNYTFNIKESILIKTLAFNLDIGSYATNHLLEGDYTLHYSSNKKELGFDSIPIRISKHPFHCTGAFTFGTVQQFALQITSKNMLVDFGKSLLTKKTAKGISIVSVKAPVDVNASLNGSLAGGNPLIIARWSTQKNVITTPLLDFDNCSFDGLYTNEVIKDSPRIDDNSKVEVYNFKGDWRGLTMTSGKIVINNLTTPVVVADMHSQFQLSQLNNVLHTEALALTDGSGSMQINYKGPVDKITPQNASMNGLLRIQNGNILMHAPNSLLTNCNATIRIVNADVIIDSLNCKLHNDPIRFSGGAKNVLALLGNSPGSASLTLNVAAPVLNIDHFSSILSRKFPSKKATHTQTGSLAKTVQQIDNLLSSGNVALNMNAAKLVFHKFEARNVSANIIIDANSWLLKKAALQHGAGSMSVTGKITEQSNNHFGLTAGMEMRNVDAQKVWYQFENFGISGLSYKNIKGILSVNATVYLSLDKSGNFDMRTLSGNADFSIKNGALINYKPVQEIQAIAFKNRNFSDIAFAEIKDKLSFTKGAITINRMEINSSVLSLFVEGVYGLTGNTDISIQVPLSNLKKRDKDYKPENLGTDHRGGMSVFLRAKSGDDGVVKIKYDPFKRFRKVSKPNTVI